MKSIKQATLFALSLLLISLIASPALATNFVTVTKDGVNVRSGPSTKNEVHWEVFKNFPLKVLKNQGEWVKTEDFEGDSGWIHKSLLVDSKKVIIKVKKANLRVGPGKNYEISATALYGVVLSPGRQDGAWVQVTHEDGTKGWCHNSLIWPQM